MSDGFAIRTSRVLLDTVSERPEAAVRKWLELVPHSKLEDGMSLKDLGRVFAATQSQYEPQPIIVRVTVKEQSHGPVQIRSDRSGSNPPSRDEAG